MPHNIYHTEGILLSKNPFGESNYFYSILTKDLGVISAMAQGVRELKSKLRGNLQTFSYGEIDLVLGRDVWRITNANTIKSFLDVVLVSEKQAVFSRVATLLRRLMPEERNHEQVFNDMKMALYFLEGHTLNSESLKNLEAILVMRILNDLGYWAHNDVYEQFLKNAQWNEPLLSIFSPFRLRAQKAINLALSESHL